MDLRLGICFFLQIFLVSEVIANNGGGKVFHVKHKFAGKERSLSAFKAHDILRHQRILPSTSPSSSSPPSSASSTVDLPLGGTGSPVGTGLYFTKIGIGSPSKDYYVQVDTGSDIFWVNCIQCSRCPRKSGLGIELKLYDPDASTTSKLLTCEDVFCRSAQSEPIVGCTPDALCEYNALYGDGSSSYGYYVKDFVKFDRVAGNYVTASANTSAIFGCGAKQSGDLGSAMDALDGLLGFGQSNKSIISQLASSGKVKRMFAHCLDGINGGGIFAIGQVVQPKVNTTPIVPNQQHYNVNLKSVEVGKVMLQLPTDVFETGDRKGTIIDSGTTLAYLPEVVYNPLIKKIKSHVSDSKVKTVEGQFTCFPYSESVDDGFPNVTFHFENSLQLVVHPHEYLFSYNDDLWCIGFQNGALQSRDARDTTLLGDLVLSNKLVLYDLENQVIGWTEYNCSSSIKMQDARSGMVHLVGSHNISLATSLYVGKLLILLLLTSILQTLIY
ncbi:hypothetical protein AQUCO_05800157v1 [Aquilegia coerulea]|uniref:Peptidase A1 domain-containing protein n=1 Tax=Aquilegia coerulea TaxID=218851 RepID=A0A2G5CF23_AQUCA|nr:hypothetical protein AQUCO_05800157v1 [Aquilegia coerulea]